ncbi:MAG: hypothetical protein KAT68_17310 [Bacteroidales bacterium]|nr:hypothetical protein [Bacteroidales bacterium]
MVDRIIYLHFIWYPRFFKNWVKDGELWGILKGKRIWSGNNLISILAGSNIKKSFKTLNDWISYAIYAYEKKRIFLLSY